MLRLCSLVTLIALLTGCHTDPSPAPSRDDLSVPEIPVPGTAPRTPIYGLTPVGWHHAPAIGYTEVVFESAAGTWYRLGIRVHAGGDSSVVRLGGGGDAVELRRRVEDAANQRVVFACEAGEREVMQSHNTLIWRVDGGAPVENPTSREELGLSDPDAVLDHEQFAMLHEILSDDGLHDWFEGHTPHGRPDLNLLGKICLGAQLGGVGCVAGGAVLFPTGCAVVGAVAGACTIIDFASNAAGHDPFEGCPTPPGAYCADCNCGGSPEDPLDP